MSLQVIGAALPRTGTLSLKFALEQLGFGPCYHMSEFILQPEHRWRWTFSRVYPSLLDPIWRNYRATVDAPGCMLWKPLARRFPGAKVILTRRDPDRWFESVAETVGRPAQARAMLRTPLAPALLANPPFGFRFDRASMVRHFHHFGEKVRESIPPSRLLEFEAKDGWEPLCAFLDVPVPDTPYPRVNERAAMQAATQDATSDISFPDMQAKTRAFLAEARQSLASR